MRNSSSSGSFSDLVWGFRVVGCLVGSGLHGSPAKHEEPTMANIKLQRYRTCTMRCATPPNIDTRPYTLNPEPKVQAVMDRYMDVGNSDYHMALIGFLLFGGCIKRTFTRLLWGYCPNKRLYGEYIGIMKASIPIASFHAHHTCVADWSGCRF